MFSPNEIAQRGDNYAGILDSLKSAAAAVLPSHTIVGKWAAGDTAGAAAGLRAEVSNIVKPPQAQPVQITPQTLTAAAGGGGFMGMSPTALAVAGLALVGLILVVKKRR